MTEETFDFWRGKEAETLTKKTPDKTQDALQMFRPQRMVCSVLDELRTMHEVRNYSGMLAAVEEIQHYVNRMETGLGTASDVAYEIKGILDDDEVTEKTAKIKALVDRRWPGSRWG